MYARVNLRAGRAVAALVERRLVAGEAGVLEVEAAGRGERRPRAAHPRRQDAVEHVDAALDHFEDAFWIADAHEVARLVRGEERRRLRDRLEHRVARLPHAEPAERVAVEVELDDLRDRAPAELRVGRALGDPEEELALGARAPAAGASPRSSSGGPPPRVSPLPAGAQTSRHIAMSEPSFAWISATDSGVKRSWAPS